MARALLLLCALLTTGAAHADDALDFKLVWSDAEHSRDAHGSESTFVVKGSALAFSSESSGRDERPKEIGPKEKTVTLKPEAQKAIRAVLEKLRAMESVDQLPKGYEGQVREMELESKSGGKTKKLRVAIRIEGYQPTASAPKAHLAALDELRSLLFAALEL